MHLQPVPSGGSVGLGEHSRVSCEGVVEIEISGVSWAKIGQLDHLNGVAAAGGPGNCR